MRIRLTTTRANGNAVMAAGFSLAALRVLAATTAQAQNLVPVPVPMQDGTAPTPAPTAVPTPIQTPVPVPVQDVTAQPPPQTQPPAQEQTPVPVQEKRTEQIRTVSEGSSGTGWDLYLGLDAGLVRTQSRNTKREANKTGFSLAVKGLTSLYLESSVIDAGGGWMYSKIKGGPAQASPGAEPDFKYIKTQTGFAEFAARYRFDKSAWELGPLAQVMFGDDSRFSPFPQKAEPNVYLGLSTIRGVRDGTLATRLGFQALTNVTARGRRVYLLSLTGQLGVTLLSSEPRVDERLVERVVAATPPPPPPPVVIEKAVEVALFGPTINFVTQVTKLSKEDERYLSAFVALLREFDGSWSTLSISGHADKRGPRALNERFAKERANAVMDALEKGGVARDRMNVTAFAFDRPLDNETGPMPYARNRRTEVVVNCTKDSVVLSGRMEALRRRFSFPTTCLKAGCP